MHSIVLLTALSATSGIFGGGRSTQQCTTGQCPNVAYAAPAAHYAPAPAPQYYSAPAPVAQPTARRQWFRPARMSYAAPTTTCANGTCYRR